MFAPRYKLRQTDRQMVASREGLPQMQPRSIALFSWLFLASLALTAALSAFSFSALKAALVRQDPGAAGLGDGVLILAVAVALAALVVLWFLIAHRASNIAKWLLVAFTLVSLALQPPRLMAILSSLDPVALLGLLAALGQLIAIAFLFRTDAREWLGREQSPDLADIG
jgi:hypothetical protein